MSFREQVTDLSANLAVNQFSGDIILKKNESAIKQHIDFLLLSDEFACIGRPYACAGLKKLINETMSDSMTAEIRNRIRDVMRNENRVAVQDIQVTYDPRTKYLSIRMELVFVGSEKNFTYETRLRRIL